MKQFTTRGAAQRARRRRAVAAAEYLAIFAVFAYIGFYAVGVLSASRVFGN